jgi:hypothetical protein
MPGFETLDFDVLGFKRIGMAALLAFVLVICLQPAYFLAMTNLDRVVSHQSRSSR